MLDGTNRASGASIDRGGFQRRGEAPASLRAGERRMIGSDLQSPGVRWTISGARKPFDDQVAIADLELQGGP
jgi:hypothetical protein